MEPRQEVHWRWTWYLLGTQSTCKTKPGHIVFEDGFMHHTAWTVPTHWRQTSPVGICPSH